MAIAPFQGRAMVGVGKLLRIYDMGKKKLLRKCENKVRQRPKYTHLSALNVGLCMRRNLTREFKKKKNAGEDCKSLDTYI